jgi:hypothetical protein
MKMAIGALLSAIAVLFLSACTPIPVDPVATQDEPTPQPTPVVIESASDVPRIPLNEAKLHFDNGTAIFVDSHSFCDYENEGHIPDAILYTYAKEFYQIMADTLGTELPKDQLIIVYCT